MFNESGERSMVMTERISLRRRIHPEQHRLEQLGALSFHSDSADLDVGTVHVFDFNDETGSGTALSFMTSRGSISVGLPDRLAIDMADGIMRLTRRQAPLPA
jgi:hypothetical protein